MFHKPGGPFVSFKYPAYRALWLSSLFAMAGMQMTMISKPWLAYDLSGSGLLLGAVALSQGLPTLVLAPLGGVAADRLNKRKLLIVSQSMLAVFSLGTAILVLTGLIQVWHIAVLSLIQGAANPFNMPTRQSYLPHLVERSDLANAVALHSTGRNVNRVLAPAIAGVLLAWHPAIAFFAIAMAQAVATATVLRLPHLDAPSTKGRGMGELLVGVRYITANRRLMILFGMAAVVITFGLPYQQLLSVFQKDVFLVGPRELGFMYTAIGIGALTGSLLVAGLHASPLKGRLQVFAGLGFGVALAIFAVSPDYWFALAILPILGLCSQSYLTLNQTIIIMHTESAFYGRVMSVNMMVHAAMPIAVLPLGGLVDLIGAPSTVAGAGIVLVLFLGAMALSRRDLLQAEPVEASPKPA